MRPYLLSLPLLSALLLGCGERTPPPSTGAPTSAHAESPAAETPDVSAPDEAALGAAIRAAVGMDSGDARYFDADVDLDGDGRAEKLVYVAGPMVCGTGGCSLFVFEATPDGYRTVGNVSVARTPVRLSPRSSMGWRNLIVHITGGGIEPGNAELAFDGTGYASNPTVEPAWRVTDLEDTEVLIPEFESYGEGKLIAPATSGAAQAGEVYGDPSVPVAGTVLGTTIHTADAEELRYVVLRQLLEPYVRSKGITVTQQEKDAYIDHVDAFMQQDREERSARREELRRTLAAGGLSETDRKSMMDELAILDELLADAEPGAAADTAEERAAREEIAEAFIGQWKINRALYEQYGGRIVFQQGGPEPLDAYRTFLEERQAQGDFTIVNDALVAEFWRYFRDDSIHSFYEPGSREEAEALATPPWLSAG